MSAEPPDKPDSPTVGAESPAAPAPPTAPSPSGEPAEPGAKFPIVGIGASAGGLEALEALTRRLTIDGMAYVVLQHLAPAHESILTEILARGTPLKVVTITDGIVVEPNTIYVTPPTVEVVLDHDVLRLRRPADRVPPHSVDTLLRSLAAERGPSAIGVVLSGAGSDGTLGLRAIKEEGGITFAQDPQTASQPSMPQSVLDAGVADYCLNPAEIGDELMRLSAHPFVARSRPPHFLGREPLARLFDMLRRAFGVDFSAYKLSTVERRVARRMALQKLDRLDGYVQLLESNGSELGVLYADLLIGVTNFFRDREPFEALKSVVFPRLLENRAADVSIRIWVPGCATGEEAYSIAISLVEYFDHVPVTHKYKVQIFATDIDDDALVRARHAVYPQSIEVDIAPDRLQRFFTRHDKGYEVSRQIRDMVVFARHNLGKDPPFSRLDLISCRNVLIYMTTPLQRKVLRVFHYALNPDGYLLLGASESVGDGSDLFSLIDRKLKIYLKKNIASAAVFDFALGARAERAPSTPPESPVERRPAITIQQLADRKVLEKFGPPGLLVDEHYDVIQFRGDTGPYLAPAPGVATLNVLKLIRPELMVELRTALQRVTHEGLPKVSNVVRVKGERTDRLVALDVMPLSDTGQRRCYLVLFREAPVVTPEPAVPAAPDGAETQEHIQDLERELLVTKEYLQTTVQELEAANEELQSGNEELQSSNEELQSTNEELETSKEELQSTNEELATVNDELQNRMTQLSIANDDLKNVIANVSTAFVIVGMDARIRTFSAEAERLLSLIPGDVGRPIAYLGTALNAPQIEALVADTINTVREREQRVRCSDGLWYTARMLPYRTSEHAIRGVVIEFLRAPPSRRLGEVLEVHELAGKVLSMLPHVLMLLDDQLRVVWVNKAFFDNLQVGAEIIGRPLDDVWAGRTTYPELWNALEETAMGGKPFANIPVAHPFGRATERAMTFSARNIPGEGDRPALTLVVMEEVAAAPDHLPPGGGG